MNLQFIKMVGNNELYVDVDNLSYVTKREYRVDSLELINRLKSLQSKINIPKILNVSVEADKITTLEQYIEGKTIAEMIEQGIFINQQQFEKYIVSLATSLQLLHQQAIIHKDIKPANIVVTDDDDIYLIDFNISRTYKAEQTKDTQLFGTEGYASPEQYGFSQTTNLSDVYSLGKTLIDLISITILSPEQFDFYNNLFKQMTALDPNNRITLEQLLKAIGYGVPVWKMIYQRLKMAISFGLIRTRGGIGVSIAVSMFFVMFGYAMIETNTTHDNGLWIAIRAIPVYYTGALAMNRWIIPLSRKLWIKLSNQNILIKAVMWYLFRWMEVFGFGFTAGIVAMIIINLFN